MDDTLQFTSPKKIMGNNSRPGSGSFANLSFGSPTNNNNNNISNSPSYSYVGSMPSTPVRANSKSNVLRNQQEKDAKILNGFDLSNTSVRIPNTKRLQSFSWITTLNLSKNGLTSIPDSLFVDLPNLIHFDISHNLLESIPTTIGNIMTLERLYLHENQIKELPLEMGRLYRLRQLSLDGNPLTVPPLDIVAAGTPSVLSYLRHRMPTGPAPPERPFVNLVDPAFLGGIEKIRCMTYNVLANIYATPEQYGYVPGWALEWGYRKNVILDELLAFDCDFLCLQEVEAGQFEKFFKPSLSNHGYAGFFAVKSRARMSDDPSLIDGCAIFYRTKRFTLLDNQTIEFQSIALEKHRQFEHDTEAMSRLMAKDNIALMMFFQVKESVPNARNTKPHYLIIANTHIHWNPDFCDVKLVQVHLLLDALQSFVISKQKFGRAAVILGGDFNSTVGSGPYELISSGRLPAHHPDLLHFDYGTLSHDGFQHSLNLGSAYSSVGEPQFTNYTATFVGILDYLFFSQDMLGVSKLLQPIPEENVKITKMPNAYYPSDHISLVAEFFFKR